MISHNFIAEAKRCCNISKSQRCNDYGVQVINGDIRSIKIIIIYVRSCVYRSVILVISLLCAQKRKTVIRYIIKSTKAAVKHTEAIASELD